MIRHSHKMKWIGFVSKLPPNKSTAHGDGDGDGDDDEHNQLSLSLGNLDKRPRARNSLPRMIAALFYS